MNTPVLPLLRSLLTVAVLMLVVSFSGGQGLVYAQLMPGSDKINFRLEGGFYSTAKDCATLSVVGSAAAQSTSTGSSLATTGSWASGLEPPYILEQFAIETLKDIAAKRGVAADSIVTEEHVIALVAFMFGEGGDINNRSGIFNPLNTGLNAPDLLASANNASGIQAFKSFDAGVEATARTMVGSNQSRLADVLMQPSSTAEQFMDALTNFQNYPGNKLWAEQSVTDPNYYNQRLSLVKTVRTNYASIAGLVIGTPALEQQENITAKEKLVYHPTGDTSTTTNINTAAPATASGVDCITTTGSTLPPDCISATGTAKILCAAKQYDSVSYVYSSGHNGAAAWHAGCPTVGPSCSLDCSGLVNVALYDAFGVDLNQTTQTEVADTTNWKRITLSEIQPGDLLQPDPGHVEIVDHVEGDTIFTFGAHSSNHPQPDQVSLIGYYKTTATNTVYLRYIGKGI